MNWWDVILEVVHITQIITACNHPPFFLSPSSFLLVRLSPPPSLSEMVYANGERELLNTYISLCKGSCIRDQPPHIYKVL